MSLFHLYHLIGRRQKTICSEPVLGKRACRFCGSQGTLSVEIRQNYFHVLFIPVFPFRKKMVLACSSCKKAAGENELDAGFLALVIDIKAKCSTPWYMFAWPLIYICSIPIAGVVQHYKHERIRAWIKAPRVNDVYEMADPNYYFAKLFRVKGDSFCFHPGKKRYWFSSSAEKEGFDGDGYFRDDTLILTQEQLLQMEDTAIEDIYRNDDK